MTTRNPPRTALARAKDDLASAEKHHGRAKARMDKANAEHRSAASEMEAADREVTAYRELVRSLGGADEAALQYHRAALAAPEPTDAL